MRVKSLNALNFRNLLEPLPELSDGINILCGENAAGKTNTLEAIFLFASGKSFRTSREKELIGNGGDFSLVSLSYSSAGYEKAMSVSYKVDGVSILKKMSVEGVGVERVSEFLGKFRAVLFTPDHLKLIKGGPEERRRLVDLALSQIKPRYVRSLNDYEKLLSARNAYLKSVKLGTARLDRDYLDVLSVQLAHAGAVITRQRALFCDKLSEISGEMYSSLTEAKERLCVRYACFSRSVQPRDEEAAAAALLGLYRKSVDSDISLGRTFYGPHRDEILIFISESGASCVLDVGGEVEGDEARAHERLTERAARSFGSQGQQRSAVLSLKLAEGQIIRELTGEYPVFLFDDLFSELDGGRRERLTRLFCGRQSVITCCDRAHIPSDSAVRLIRVENGRYYGG